MKKLVSNIKAAFTAWNNRRRMARCIRAAARIVAKTKAQYPGCEGAMAAWTDYTGAGSLASGLLMQGVTTVRWGSAETVTRINGTNNNGITVGVVTRINQRTLVDNIKLPQGVGLTSTRIQVIDGQLWDVTIRDDTALGIPRIGTTVVVVDMGGHIGNIGLKYSATVIEDGYDTAPKQAGERTFSVESLILIESQTGS